MNKSFLIITVAVLFLSCNAYGQNLISNGNFESGFTDWNNIIGSNAEGIFSLETIDVAEGNNAMKVEIITTGPNAWDVQTIHGGWASVTGTEYTLRFKAKAANSGVHIKAIQQKDTYSQYEISLGTSYTDYSWTFTAKEDGLQLKFHFPQAGTIFIDDVYIEDPTTSSEYYTRDTLTLDTAKSYQEMKGFGGALTWYSSRIPKSPYKEDIYDLLFEDLGMDILRLKNWYYPEDYPNHKEPDNMEISWFLEDYNTTIELFHQAKSHDPDMEVLLSSWSPSSYLKSNNALQQGKLKHNGSEFMYSEFALYNEDMLSYLAAESVYPDYVSIQNEPGFVSENWETCEWRPTETADFAGYDIAFDSVYKRIQKMDHTPKFIGAESENIGWDSDINDNNFRGFTTPIKDNPNLHAYAYHLYNFQDLNEAGIMSSTKANLNMIRDEFPDKPAMMTEFGGYTWFNQALMIHQNLAEANAAAYIYWQGAWDSDEAMIRVYTDGGYAVQPHYYTMKHFSKFIDEGYKRIDLQNTNPKMAVTAYLHPSENKITYILINRNSKSVTTLLGLDDYKVINTRVIQSIEGDMGQDPGRFPSDSVDLPARSITTMEIEYTEEPTYTLTVVNGQFSGEYPVDYLTEIIADSPRGKQFEKWIGDIAYIGDVYSKKTNLTMPAKEISLTATYTDMPELILSVEGGSGSGIYYEAEIISVMADDSTAWRRAFLEWTGDVEYVADVYDANTTVTMPSGDVSITATYTDMPDYVKDTESDNLTSEFKLFPNPTEEFVHISYPGDYSITIFNMSGDKFAYYGNLSESQVISLSEYPSGVYFIHMTSAGRDIIKRLRIQ